MIYWNTSNIVQRIFKNFEWRGNPSQKVIHLTFDDGPTPEVTNRALDILDTFHAKATFFCLGRNVDRHRELFKEILERGHAVGNHSYSHLKGWRTPAKMYIHDANLARKYIDTHLFRPPYGRITRLQVRYLRKFYRLIMWDVLTHDYNRRLSPEKCLQRAIRNTKNGSIVVFHDSVKASRNMLYILPRYIEHFTKLGFRFEKIE